MTIQSSEDKIFIPINPNIYAEFVRRGKARDAFGIIENVVEDFLERTKYDDNLWSQNFIDELDEEELENFTAEFGRDDKGYQWQNVFLPNGTELKMTYKSNAYYASVRFEHIVYKELHLSPSEFARKVAENTSRNAWRDIWIKRPNDKEWLLADDLRRNIKK